MSALADQVREFHEVYGAAISPVPTVGPAELRQLRIDLIQEELDEFAQACGALNTEYGDWVVIPGISPDMVEMADALGDLLYVVQGAMLSFGFPAEAIVAAIHQSNMSKLDAEGKVVAHPTVVGKVGKGPNYAPPTEDIKRILGL